MTDQTSQASPAVRRSMSGKSLAVTSLAVAAAIGAVIYGAHWWTDGRYKETTDDAYVGGDITTVSPKVPGYIATLAVQDNQQVHAGDLLVKLDDRDFRAALAKAEAAIAAQQALLANLDATQSLQQAVIAQARAGVVASTAETTRAKEDESRYQALVGKAAVSAQSAEKATADYKQAQANEQRAQAGVVAAERELAVIGTRRQQAGAALAQATAERDLARLNLSYTEIRAPIDGVVGNRRARGGAYVSVGNPLLVIVPSQGLWVDANFKESQLARFKPGLAATIEVDALPGRKLHGHLASLAPATGAQFSVLPAENATGNFTKIVQRVPVRIVLDKADAALGALRPGLSVTAEVDARASEDKAS